MMNESIYPNRYWMQHNNGLWSSRELTKEDIERRKNGGFNLLGENDGE